MAAAPGGGGLGTDRRGQLGAVSGGEPPAGKFLRHTAAQPMGEPVSRAERTGRQGGSVRERAGGSALGPRRRSRPAPPAQLPDARRPRHLDGRSRGGTRGGLAAQAPGLCLRPRDRAGHGPGRGAAGWRLDGAGVHRPAPPAGWVQIRPAVLPPHHLARPARLLPPSGWNVPLRHPPVHARAGITPRPVRPHHQHRGAGTQHRSHLVEAEHRSRTVSPAVAGGGARR